MKILKIVASVFCYTFSLGGTIATITQKNPVDIIANVIIIIIFLVLGTLLMKSANKMQNKAGNAPKEPNDCAPKKKKEPKDLVISAPHVNGLPVAENILCVIYSRPTKYEITANGATFNLDKNKVTDVCLKTDVEIQKQYISSIGGAVLFGSLGAIVGGRAKKKKTKKTHTYLIFTYESDGEIKYIGFDVTNNFNAPKLVNEFRKTSSNNKVEINL
jgi:hypothetical protein